MTTEYIKLTSQEKRDFHDLTDEDREVMLRLLRLGHTRGAVAKAMQIRPTKLTMWLKKGRSERPENCYRKFYNAVVQAEGDAQLELERVVIEAASSRVADAKWLLKNRFGLSDSLTMTREAREEIDTIKVQQAEETLKLTKARTEVIEKQGKDVTPKMWAAMFNSLTEDEEDTAH